MVSPQPTGSSSLGSLSDDIDHIYRNYTNGTSRNTLDSGLNEPAVQFQRPSVFRYADQDSPNPRSDPATPISSSSFDFTQHDDLVGATNSSLNVLLTPNEPKSRLGSTDSSITNSALLKSKDLEASKSVDSIPGYEHSELSSSKSKDEDWSEKGAAVAKRSSSSGDQIIRRTVKDFEFGKDLGEGSYSTVVLATDKITSVKYAVKILDKRHIIKEKKVKYVNIEKHALNRLSNVNGIISLFFTFQDRESLYFVLDFASNGELLGLIKQYGTLNENCTRYFCAQILDAIHHMHINGVIHRDIKPENILLDDKYRIRITDFGTAKLLERRKNGDTGAEEDYPLDVRAKSFVGTAEYVSPELLDNKYCGKPGDVWAFGCIMYQMIAGKPPFKATNDYLTFQKITKLQYAFSAGFPAILRDLIKQILVLQPSRRATIEQIQKHLFFQGCNFDDPASIWESKVPEITPYKMTAQSMMKMPANSQQPKSGNHQQPKPAGSQQPKPTKKVVKKAAPKPASQSKSAHPDSHGSRNFTPASVAAYVLSKDDEEHHESSEPASVSQKPSTPSSRNGSTSHPSPDYIPGTKILRPQINSIATFTRTSTSSNSSKSDKESLKRAPSRVLEVTPQTAVEEAWIQYLSPNERVIHLGSALVRKQSTEAFEKKHKGMIHDSPLGFNNKLSTARSSSRSMLSQVVQGTRLKDASDAPATQYSETDAITMYVYDFSSSRSNTDDDKGSASNTAKLGKSLFKKFLPGSDKKQENGGSTESAGSSGSSEERMASFSLEKARACTVLVTTFGRALIFLRDDHNNDYKLVSQIKLNFPFIQFKEVLTNSGNKFNKLIPLTGIFAIVSQMMTFLFEVEKYEVNQWTDALAKSKLNQFEREKESEAQSSLKTVSNSPKLMESPHFNPAVQRTPVREDSPPVSASKSTHKPTKPKVDTGNDSKEHSLLSKKLKNRDTMRRKPPPSVPTSPTLEPNGLIRNHGQGDTIHAAQLAVSNSPNVTMDNRRSSFSKTGTPTSAYKPTSSPGTGVKITSMNSKFLARSRGKR